MESPSGENRGGTPIGERAFARRALHRQVQRVMRLSAFCFLFFLLTFLSVLEALIVTAPAPTASVI
jgi:hypothetical protein